MYRAEAAYSHISVHEIIIASKSSCTWLRILTHVGFGAGHRGGQLVALQSRRNVEVRHVGVACNREENLLGLFSLAMYVQIYI